MKRKLALFGLMLSVAVLVVVGCFPSDSTGANPYDVRVWDTSSNASPVYVKITGIVSYNGTYELMDGSVTDIVGVVVGDGAVIGYVTRPSGDLVGTTQSQTLTNKTVTDLVTNKITITDGYYFVRAVNNSEINIIGAPTGGEGGQVRLFGRYSGGRPGELHINTPSATWAASAPRVHFKAGATKTEVHWLNSYHTGIVLGGYLDAETYYIEFQEMTAPGAGSADEVRLYAVVGGDTLTDMAVVFQDGTVDIFAQETTPLDSPIFRYPSGTETIRKMLKPHPGLIQFVEIYPDGSYFVMREIEYHDAEKIAANVGCDSDKLPDGWMVTTLAERVAENIRIIDEQLAVDGLDQSAKAELLAQRDLELARLRK